MCFNGEEKQGGIITKKRLPFWIALIDIELQTVQK